MEPWLLFFDIDGTLLDNDTNQVPDSTIKALKKAQAAGHKIFLCTGRSRVFIPKQVAEIGFDGMVAGCGTAIYYEGQKKMHATLPQKLQREIAEDMLRCRLDGVLEGDRYCYFQDEPFLPWVKKFYHDNGVFFGPDCQKKWQQEETLAFDKFTLWFNEHSDIDGFKSKYEKQFDFIRRASDFYEVVPKGYSKATGIERMCRETGVEQRYTMGFGDSTNDLPMLDYTAVSVAMGNSDPVLFDRVDYVTASVKEDGIEKALYKYNMIE